ncbi:MAG: hypothetical protein AAGI66_01590 [Cyanobacteria bacterium P01_H01_bin.74]
MVQSELFELARTERRTDTISDSYAFRMLSQRSPKRITPAEPTERVFKDYILSAEPLIVY